LDLTIKRVHVPHAEWVVPFYPLSWKYSKNWFLLDELGHLHFLLDEMGLDEMGLDEMGLDEMGLDEMGLNEMGLDEMG